MDMAAALLQCLTFWMISILVLSATTVICLGYIADKLKHIADMMEDTDDK